MLHWFQKALHRCRPVQLNLLLQPQLCTKGRMKTTDPHSSPAISHPNVPVVKLIIIGDSNVGKSCLLQRFCDDEFSPSFIATIGIDHRSKTISLGSGDNLKLQIWDTAGQEQYKAMTSSMLWLFIYCKGFYRSAMGVAVVYDVTWRRSFMNIPNWIRNLEEHASDKIVKFLVGNKCDVEENRVRCFYFILKGCWVPRGKRNGPAIWNDLFGDQCQIKSKCRRAFPRTG